MTFSGGLLRRFRTRRRASVAVVTICVLAGTVGAAEWVIRDRVHDRFAAAAQKRLGKAPEVDLGGTPVLWQVAQGTFPDVGLTADGVSAQRMTDLHIDARLRQVRRGADAVTVRSSTVRVGIDAESLAGDGLKRMNGVVVPDPDTGRLLVHLGRAGAITVPLTPTLRGEAIDVTAHQPTLHGEPLPEPLSRRIADQARRTVQLTDLPLELKAQRLTVTDDGLSLVLHGGPATLDA